jgi:hypothetical protein
VRVDLENVSNGSAVEALWALGAPEPKRLKRPDGGLGCGGRGAKNSSQRRRFLPPFHRYLDLSGINRCSLEQPRKSNARIVM